MNIEQIRYKRMTETPITRLISSLAAPSVLSMLITSVYNMTDTYFVSKIDLSAAAAVGVVFALMSLIQSVGFTIGMGASSYMSRYLGKKDSESANLYASSAVGLALVAGTVMTAVGLAFLTPLMRLLGSTETALPYAREYSSYILVGAPVMCVLFVLNKVLNAEGQAKLSMISVVSGGILNVALDPLFIYTFDMGMAGAALATLISQTVSLIIVILIFVCGKTIVKLSLKSVSLKPQIYFNIIKNGFPTLCRQGLASVASALLTVFSKPYGDAAIAAVTISTKIYTMMRSLIIGIGQGYQPMAGYNYGAGRFDRVKKGFYFSVLLGTAICTAATFVLWFNADAVISFFRENDRDVIKIGGETLRYFCVVLPLLAYSTYVNQMFQCLGRSRSAAFLASCRQGIFYVPLIFVLSRNFGLTGIEITQASADFLTFLISVPFQIHFFIAE